MPDFENPFLDVKSPRLCQRHGCNAPHEPAIDGRWVDFCRPHYYGGSRGGKCEAPECENWADAGRVAITEQDPDAVTGEGRFVDSAGLCKAHYESYLHSRGRKVETAVRPWHHFFPPKFTTPERRILLSLQQ
jgi:hypothetical protein